MVAFVSESKLDPLVVVLLGPTGSGKTRLSLRLAEEFGGEVVNCDSVAVYRGMDVGSAKPSRAEMRQVPHHLIDIASPEHEYTAGAYSRAARAALAEITGRGKMPIVTGGTGLYLRALTEGLFSGPERDDALRERLKTAQQKHGGPWLHRILQRLDSLSAGRIHANDIPKLIRAIEVCLKTGRPISALLERQEEARDPLTGYRLLRIGLSPPRAALYERLDRRCQEIFAEGLVEETRGLLSAFGRVKALDALGYRQALAMIDGQMSEAEALAATQQGHRNYAKRQMTWFRREPEVHWIEDFGSTAQSFEAVRGLIAAM